VQIACGEGRWQLRHFSCVEVIVPARFRKAEGLSGDDAEEVPPVIRDKLSQRDVAGNGPRGPRWPGKQLVTELGKRGI
jgi:hypothetical protein